MVMTQTDIRTDQLRRNNVQVTRGDHSSSRVVLDIGCGSNKVPGAIGVDCMALSGVDVVHDLERYPYPFATDSVDEIHAYHVMEHVPDVMATMEELWRISKAGATVHIRVPHFTGILAWKDPTHKRSFTSESFGYFGQNGYSYYTGARFDVMSVSLRYSIQPKNRWIARVFAKVMQRLLDWHPTFGERHLAYLVGGIDEIRATLKAIKPAP
jgi:SAM-dependent methyltransferase